jgi:isochorismate hydrolase
MKTTYFSTDNIEHAAGEMLTRLEAVYRRSEISLPSRTALLVLDMQDYFLDLNSHAFVPSAPAILPGIQVLVAAFHAQAMPVIFTRHLNTRQNAGMMAHWWRDLIAAENPLSQIAHQLNLSTGTVIEKTQYDAFHQTELENLLAKENVSAVAICGVMTHLCCETTARSAFTRGLQVWFTIDGTATYNEAHHFSTLLNLAHGFATPVTVAEVLAALPKTHEI